MLFSHGTTGSEQFLLTQSQESADKMLLEYSNLSLILFFVFLPPLVEIKPTEMDVLQMP